MRALASSLFAFSLVTATLAAQAQSAKPAISLDEFLNSTSLRTATLSPTGSSAVLATTEPDWKSNTFSHELWLWSQRDGLRPLTHSGSEEEPHFSPDGRWIAFISDRALPGEEAGPDGAAKDRTARLWLLPTTGGEALPLYAEKLEAGSYAWSTDGKSILLSTTKPLSKDEEESKKNDWKDVQRWREDERGDLLLSINLEAALNSALATPAVHAKESDAKLPATAKVLAESPLSITEIAPSPDGARIAFETGPTHKRIERMSDYELFLLPTSGGKAEQITRNDASESDLHWAPDSRAIYFGVRAAGGAIEGPYRDIQGRLYRIDAITHKIERLGAEFKGSFGGFTLTPDGRLLALGQLGTEQQIYQVEGESANLMKGLPGTYEHIEAAHSGTALLLLHSTINQPAQAFLAPTINHLADAMPLSNFNPIFAERATPDWQPYTWTSDDGSSVEGVLIFPPGKKGQKHLRMLTLIHGGPADADGNRFGADWYDWATLAASDGWLIFRPNYRGSTGYGDKFMLEIAPHLVSQPGKDILAGVDALVKDGIADPDHLAVGGYSYGGYMTNWLITQTTRFRSAVTGAGAVEHAANWGNDDMTRDDAWYLGGRPWENPQLYTDEGALFHFDKVKTPTHLVQGSADVRVSYLEGVAMERAFDALAIPHTFLVLPGEGHGLKKNPWHGYIKLREELKWLESYDAAK